MKRLGVLGTFVRDTIHHPDRGADAPLRQWGGIAYSLSAFDAACPPGWSIYPVIRVGEDLGESAVDFLSGFSSIATLDGIRIVEEPTNRVELRYLDRAERTERLTGGVSAWSWDDLRPLLGHLDALYINYISGFELELATARRVREAFSAPIYADLHSLFLGPPGDGPREPKLLDRGEEWLLTADYVQMNEIELGLLEAGGVALPRGGGNASMGTASAAAPVLLVTRGARGASYHAPGEGVAGEVAVPLPDGALDGDPTGCGDVWGAVAYAGLLEGRPLDEAILRAHRAAAAKMGHGGMTGLAEAIRAAEGGHDRSRRGAAYAARADR